MARRPRDQNDGTAPRGTLVHPWFRAHAAQPGLRMVGPYVRLGRFIGRGEHHSLAVDREHLVELEAGRGDRPAISCQPPRVAGVDAGQQDAGGRPHGQPGHELHPRVVALLS
jgi:hypothetical protein